MRIHIPLIPLIPEAYEEERPQLQLPLPAPPLKKPPTRKPEPSDEEEDEDGVVIIPMW